MDLSLDELIKNKSSNSSNRRRGRNNFASGRSRPFSANTANNRSRPSSSSVKRQNGQRRSRNKGPMLDARLKIIQKSRRKIVDARDRLAELAKHTDARLRLQKMRNSRMQDDSIMMMPPPTRREMIPRLQVSHNPFANIRRELTITNNIIPRLNKSKAEIIDVSPNMICRTVKNDMQSSLQSSQQNMLSWRSQAVNMVPQHMSQKSASVMSERPEWRKKPSVLKNAAPVALSSTSQEGRMNLQMKTRLDNREAAAGHRIVVSNLQPSVTDEDIRELFEDIGNLVSSHLVRPGTAEVVYRSHKDAVKAVDVYHNRQLDGQPMKCFLVNSTNSGSKLPAAPVKLTVVPSIDTIHKVLFSK